MQARLVSRVALQREDAFSAVPSGSCFQDVADAFVAELAGPLWIGPVTAISVCIRAGDASSTGRIEWLVQSLLQIGVLQCELVGECAGAKPCRPTAGWTIVR